MKNQALVLFAALVTLLAGCSQSPMLQKYYSGLISPLPQGEMLVIPAGTPLLALWALDKDVAVSLYEAENRNGVRLWRGTDGVGLYTRDGMLIGSRGLSDDLMEVRAEGAASLIASGSSGQITRIHSMLNGSDRLELRSWICDITPEGQARIQVGDNAFMQTLTMREACYGPEGNFDNLYQVANGRIVQSETIFSPAVGRLRLLFLP